MLTNHNDKVAKVQIVLEFDLFPDADTKRLEEELRETMRCHVDGDWNIQTQFKTEKPIY